MKICPSGTESIKNLHDSIQYGLAKSGYTQYQFVCNTKMNLNHTVVVVQAGLWTSPKLQLTYWDIT